MLCKIKTEEFLSILADRMKLRQFSLHGKKQFERRFDGGCWIFKAADKYSKTLGGYVITFPLFVRLEGVERVTSALWGTKYSKTSVTGGCNMGHLFCNKCLYEILITDNTNVNDVADDVMYYFEKYALPLIAELVQPADFYREMQRDGRLFIMMSAHNMDFQYAAMQYLQGEYEKMSDTLDSIGGNGFSAVGTSKEKCLEAAEMLVRGIEK